MESLAFELKQLNQVMMRSVEKVFRPYSQRVVSGSMGYHDLSWSFTTSSTGSIERLATHFTQAKLNH